MNTIDADFALDRVERQHIPAKKIVWNADEEPKLIVKRQAVTRQDVVVIAVVVSFLAGAVVTLAAISCGLWLAYSTAVLG